MRNISLKILFPDLERRFGFEYLLTYRLNQDILEILETDDSNDNLIEELETLNYDDLENLGGYICRKLKIKNMETLRGRTMFLKEGYQKAIKLNDGKI